MGCDLYKGATYTAANTVTFISDCRLLKAHPLFPYILEKRLAIPTSPFFSKSFLCY